MTSNPIPSAFFGAGYTYASNVISFNTAAHATPLVLELTAAEANVTTGDYRSILYALMEMLKAKMDAASPVSNKAAVIRSTYEDTSTGEFVRTYTVTIRTNAAGLEVANE